MVKKAIRWIDRTFLFVEEWSLFLAVMTALCVAMANVVLRKLTSDLNLYWSDEIVRKTIFFTTYFGCIAAIRGRSLIRVDAVPQLFPFLRRFLDQINHLAVLLFSGLMIKFGWALTTMVKQDEYALTATLQIPEWYFYAVLPTMGAMMFVRTLIVMVEDLFRIDLTGKEEAS